MIGWFKDVRAHCYCTSLVHTLFIRHAHATSFSSERTKSKTQQNIELMTFELTWCAKIFFWMLSDPHFFFGRSLPFLILSSILKDIHTNCFCASLLSMVAHANSHATSCIKRACQVLKWTIIGQMAIAIALLGFNNLGCSGGPHFSFQKQILFTIISTYFKNEQKINVGS